MKAKMRFLTLCCCFSLGIVHGQEVALAQQAKRAMRLGAEFFRNRVAVEGTYLWEYSEDLSKREGEGVASSSQGWVQPPGTPSVGLAFLKAYDATGDTFYLDAARETAEGLRRGQLLSGGWHYAIDFSREGSRKAAYRVDGKPTARNVTTFDDDTTQAALRFLMRLDQRLKFQEVKVHEPVEFALRAVLRAQYPNGGWPQGYERFPDPSAYPVRKASVPDDWPRVWPGSQQYWLRYTLNDNVLINLVERLLEAERIYRGPSARGRFEDLSGQCRAAAEKAGDFLILAQMPEPQPAWAQQYDFEMHPAWARKFEPPAVTGGESQGVLRCLLRLFEETGQRKYLEPVPRALAYFQRSRLPDGRLARFYEMGSNRPLYFTRDYQLTYADADVPTHYSFKVTDGAAAIHREYEKLIQLGSNEPKIAVAPKMNPQATDELAKKVASIIRSQDPQGRWIEEGGLTYHRPKDPSVRIIRSATFAHNLEMLSDYLAAVCPPPP